MRPTDPFETLLTPHLPRLHALAYRLSRSAADAEDLVQDVLVKLYPRYAEVAAVRDLAPWLARVLYHQFIDDRRRYGRRNVKLVTPSGGDGLDELPASAAETPAAAALRRDVQMALDRLSEEHRLVVVLHDVAGYQLTEIQELTDTPIGTLKSRLHRARARLREILADDGTSGASPTCMPVYGARSDAL